MLVLGRNCGERIVIGDDITITVLEVRGMEAVIGVDAPKKVLVHRGEDTEKTRELVFLRKLTQVIVIGSCIKVTLLEIKGNKVRFGVDAPRDIPVHRSEIADMIKRKKGIRK